MKIFQSLLLATIILAACKPNNEPKSFTGQTGEVKLMTLDPGHFHAALIQKSMYPQIDPNVHVYAPAGQDVEGHIARIESFNSRAESPTSWDLKVYKGDDFFAKMLKEKPGNLMNVSGNNAKKTEYILATVKAGINVLADKPMAINSSDFALLEEAFAEAKENNVLLYDVMTERYEITTTLQRELSQMPEVFGQLTVGSAEEPAITKESVHHLYKYVAGKPLKRPAWFFDTEQQGEGIVDVNTHLVDLIQWEAFPNVVLHKEDIEIVSAKRWTTDLTPRMFEEVTHLKEFPKFLEKDIEDNQLKIYCNGEIIYKLKGIFAKASVTWNFKAPEGTKDTHYSIMRGTLCDLSIKQGKEEGFKPTLYIEAKGGHDLSQSLAIALKKLNEQYPGLELQKVDNGVWRSDIPQKYKVGHEAHFAQVTQKYLQFLIDGKLPEWEIPNMITKYYTTTKALEMAQTR